MVSGVKGVGPVVLALLCAASGRWGRRARPACTSRRPVTTAQGTCGGCGPRRHGGGRSRLQPRSGRPVVRRDREEQSWCDFVKRKVGDGFPVRAVGRQPREQRSERQHQRLRRRACRTSCPVSSAPMVASTTSTSRRMTRWSATCMISPALPFPDSTWSYTAGTPRYEWTARRYRRGTAAEIPWVVVGMHKPCLSVGAVRLRSRAPTSPTCCSPARSTSCSSAMSTATSAPSRSPTVRGARRWCPARTTPTA